jgi:hypothetical protein
MLLTRQARGHARLREAREALDALTKAEDYCARGRGEDDPHWLYWVNPGEIMGQTGSCYLDLDQPAQAAKAFGAARDVLSTEETRTTAQFLSRAATAQMRAGEADAGCAIAHDVLTLSDGIQSARLDDHLRNMLTEAQRLVPSTLGKDLVERGVSIMRERASS